MDFIFNNSPIVELIQNCKLHDCIELFSKNHNLFIPTRVYEEFKEGNPHPSDIECVENHFRIIDVNEDPFILSFFDHDPTQGEYLVIAHAYHNPECCVVIDEGYGRFITQELGLSLTGTIGILRRMRDECILSRDLLETAKKTISEGNFYIDKDLKRELELL